MRGGWGGGRFLFVPFVFVRSEDSKRACPGHEGTAKWYIRQMFKQTPEFIQSYTAHTAPNQALNPLHNRTRSLSARSATPSSERDLFSTSHLHRPIGRVGESPSHLRLPISISHLHLHLYFISIQGRQGDSQWHIDEVQANSSCKVKPELNGTRSSQHQTTPQNPQPLHNGTPRPVSAQSATPSSEHKRRCPRRAISTSSRWAHWAS